MDPKRFSKFENNAVTLVPQNYENSIMGPPKHEKSERFEFLNVFSKRFISFPYFRGVL